MCLNNDMSRLDIFYDYSALTEKLNKRILSGRSSGVWKYFELLPVRDEKTSWIWNLAARL